jgi:N-acyl-D-amino-acid deacylase
MGVTDRGTIAAGKVADLVLFDPATFTDRSADAEPTLTATGVEAVLIGGRLAIDGGVPVDVGLGRVIRRRSPAA